VLVDAGSAERAPAGAGGDLPALEVAEELGPFGVGGDAVLVGGTLGAAAGEEGQVGLDGLLGVDGLVAEGDVDVAVPGDDLGDVRGQAVEDGIGDEHPAEIVRRAVQRLAGGGVGQPGAGQRAGEDLPGAPVGDGPPGGAVAALEQQRRGRGPCALVAIVGADQRDGAAGLADPADDRGEDVGELGTDDDSLN
jgi:hypothetical protein